MGSNDLDDYILEAYQAGLADGRHSAPKLAWIMVAAAVGVFYGGLILWAIKAIVIWYQLP